MKRGALLLCLCLSLPAAAQTTFEMPHQENEAPQQPHTPKLTKPPSLLKFVQAPYPTEAESLALAGDVSLDVDIAADGTVSDARVVKPAGHGFDDAAVAAVKQFQFSPAEIDDKPSPVTIGYTYHFRLAPPAPVTPSATEKAPTVHLTGVVLERASKKPLPGVSINVDGSDLAVTGKGGTFALDLPAGNHFLTFTAAGYQPLEKSVELKLGKFLNLTLFLRQQIEGLFQTVVKATAEKDVVEEYTLDREQVRRAPGTFGDPLHVIEDLPGVARTPFDLGFLIVNGANPLDTPVYFDGLQIPLLYHFGGGPAVVNPEFIDQLDFYPGGEGVRYGHAIGGTVDIDSRTLKPDRIHASADVNLAFAQAFLEVPLPDDWLVAAAGRRSYFDFVIKPFLSSGTVVVPYFWDYQFKIQKGKPGDKNIFSLMAYGSNDTLDVLSQNFASSQTSLNVDYNTQFHKLVGRWDFKEGNFTSSLRPEAGIQNLNLAFGSSTIYTNQYDLSLRHDMSYQLSPKNKLNFGEDFTFSWFNANLQIPSIPEYNIFPGSDVQEPLQSLQALFKGVRLGVWVEDVFSLRSNFKIIPGLRLEGYDEFYPANGGSLTGGGPTGSTFLASVDPRLAFRWTVTPKLVLKGSIGLYHEPPPLQYFDGQFGNSQLSLLQSIQYLGGFEYTILPPLHLEAVGYYSDRSGLLNGFLGPSEPGQTSLNNAGFGRAYGLEVYLHHDITPRLFGWLSYTFSSSELTNGQNQAWYLSAYDETHILSAILSYNLGAGFILGGRFRYVTGTPITPIVNSVYDGDQDSYTPIYGTPDSQRISDFKQLDIRLDKEITYERWKLDIYLDVWNALNFKNEEFRVYDYRSRTYASLPGYPVLPLFGIRGEY